MSHEGEIIDDCGLATGRIGNNRSREVNQVEDIISGDFRIGTPHGVITIQLKDANVIQGKDLLESFRVSPNQSKLQHAQERLDDYIATFPASNAKPFRRDWEKMWEQDVRRFGSDALVTLFPTQLPRNTSLLKTTIHYLYRWGVQTREQLRDLPQDSPLLLDPTGRRGGLITAMRALAIAAAAVAPPVTRTD